MPRDAPGLSLEDLRLLSRLFAAPRKSVVAAAAALNVERARLIRLLSRVGAHLGGGPLSWRGVGGLVAPPEVRRLLDAFQLFAVELDGGGSPRVSAGSSASILLAQTLAFLGQPLPGLRLARSGDVAGGLRSATIDIALVHEGSIAGWPFRLEEDPLLTSVALLPWRAVRCRAARGQSQGTTAVLCWDPGSTGERLAAVHGVREAVGPAWPCHSYIHALELLRRGIVAEAIVPSIYVPPADPLVVPEPIDNPTEDRLVAIYRREEGSRWKHLLRPEAWVAAVGSHPGPMGLLASRDAPD